MRSEDKQSTESGSWRPIVIGAIVVIIVLALYGSRADSTDTETTSGSNVSSGTLNNTERIGSAAVYARIESSTSCVVLQREFDTAMDNVERYSGGDDRRKIPFSYANAADSRMREIGCYG